MTEPSLNYVQCPDASGGHRMAYWQWGNPEAGHVVVCVHGLTRQGRDFDVLARALCQRGGDTLRVVCPDVAGRGQSDWLKDPLGYQIPSYAADMLALLAHLQPTQEVLLLGWGVPMPLPVQSRRYDNIFWEELLGKSKGKMTTEEAIKDLGF